MILLNCKSKTSNYSEPFNFPETFCGIISMKNTKY